MFENICHVEECLYRKELKGPGSCIPQHQCSLLFHRNQQQKRGGNTYRHMWGQIIEYLIPKYVKCLIKLWHVHSSSSFGVDHKVKTNDQFGSSSVLKKNSFLICRSVESTNIFVCIFFNNCVLDKLHCIDKNLNIVYSSLLNYAVFDIWKLKSTVD